VLPPEALRVCVMHRGPFFFAWPARAGPALVRWTPPPGGAGRAARPRRRCRGGHPGQGQDRGGDAEVEGCPPAAVCATAVHRHHGLPTRVFMTRPPSICCRPRRVRRPLPTVAWRHWRYPSAPLGNSLGVDLDPHGKGRSLSRCSSGIGRGRSAPAGANAPAARRPSWPGRPGCPRLGPANRGDRSGSPAQRSTKRQAARASWSAPLGYRHLSFRSGSPLATGCW